MMTNANITIGLTTGKLRLPPPKPKRSILGENFIAGLMAMAMQGRLPRKDKASAEPVPPPEPRKMYGNSKWHRRVEAAGLKGVG